jgi:hypothetical protein
MEIEGNKQKSGTSNIERRTLNIELVVTIRPQSIQRSMFVEMGVPHPFQNHPISLNLFSPLTFHSV